MTSNEYLDKRVSELNKKLSASFVRPMALKEIYKILDPEGKIFDGPKLRRRKKKENTNAEI